MEPTNTPLCNDSSAIDAAAATILKWISMKEPFRICRHKDGIEWSVVCSDHGYLSRRQEYTGFVYTNLHCYQVGQTPWRTTVREVLVDLFALRQYDGRWLSEADIIDAKTRAATAQERALAEEELSKALSRDF